MIDNKVLQELITDYESVLQIVTKNIKILRNIAMSQGVLIETKQPVENDVRRRIEKERQTLMEQMQKMREEAQLQAKQAMENATRNMPSMGMPNVGMSNMGMPNMGMPNMGMPNMGMPNMGMPNISVPNMGEFNPLREDEDEKK